MRHAELRVREFARARNVGNVSVSFDVQSRRAVSEKSNRKDFGIVCVIAPSFGEIFQHNCMQNGMLPIVLTADECRILAQDAEERRMLEVDLEAQEIRRTAGGTAIPFTIDPLRRHRLLNGLDDITLTLQREDAIARFEERRAEKWPWLDKPGHENLGSRLRCTKGQATSIDW